MERVDALLSLAWHSCSLIERADSPYSDSLQTVFDRMLQIMSKVTALVASDSMMAEGKQAEPIDEDRALLALSEVEFLLSTEAV